MEPLLSAWFLGLLLGARHAFEPDHLAAMATLVSTERRAALLGALWGAGHAATLLAVGGALVVLRARLPGPVAQGFEAAVAAMLLGLGARSIWWAVRHHRHAPDHVHVGRRTLPKRPFFVGMAHGLAGSGALTALALASMPSTVSALIYLALFGLGSVLAMAAASGLLGWPLARASRNAAPLVASLAGALSVATGLFWGWRTLF
jgi:ABC-type nickel/cobalt efflux system permease component RcnA